MDYFAADCFSGMETAYPECWQSFGVTKNSGILMKRKPTLDQVAVIVSGGAGNGPLFQGYVGDGLADAAVVGATFAAPNAYAIYEAGKYLGREKGVLLLYNNFAGDYLNNDMAKELLEMDGIQVESVICTDDVASALGESRNNRSGGCGIALLIKLAGSCAKLGMSLGETASLLRQASLRLGTISMHVDFKSKQIVFGAGFSGEPGMKTTELIEMRPAAQEAVTLLIEDLKPAPGEKLFLLVNRLRLTSYSDNYIMANAVYSILSEQYSVQKMRVGAFSNIVDTYGFDFSILCMDEKLEELLKNNVATDCFII